MMKTAANFWVGVMTFVLMLGLALTGILMAWVLPPWTGRSSTLLGYDRHDYGSLHTYLAIALVCLVVLHIALHWSWVCCAFCRQLGRGAPSERTRKVAALATIGATLLVASTTFWWLDGRVQRSTSAGFGRYSGATTFSKQPPAQAKLGHSGVPLEWEQGPSPEPSDLSHARAERRSPARRQHEDGSECPVAASIHGRMTLSDAAALIDVSPSQLAVALGLPKGADPNTRIGRLRKRYGFSIQKLRQVACQSPSSVAQNTGSSSD